MPPTRRRYLAAAAGAITLAGCQGAQNGQGTDGTTPTDQSTETDGGGGGTSPAVQVSDHPDHGRILVDADGMTLYMFDSDSKGSGSSTCSGGCLDAWPPLTVEGEATAGGDVTAPLTTFVRSDGDTQVAADGWPLYYYARDSDAGDVTGQGANDVWWVLTPAGEPIRETAAAGTTDESGIGY